MGCDPTRLTLLPGSLLNIPSLVFAIRITPEIPPAKAPRKDPTVPPIKPPIPMPTIMQTIRIALLRRLSPVSRWQYGQTFAAAEIAFLQYTHFISCSSPVSQFLPRPPASLRIADAH
jgi:hypothetical protein